MPRKSEIFRNADSKRAVKVQIRAYDEKGQYELLADENNATLQIKNATAAEVIHVVRAAISKTFS